MKWKRVSFTTKKKKKRNKFPQTGLEDNSNDSSTVCTSNTGQFTSNTGHTSAYTGYTNATDYTEATGHTGYTGYTGYTEAVEEDWGGTAEDYNNVEESREAENYGSATANNSSNGRDEATEQQTTTTAAATSAAMQQPYQSNQSDNSGDTNTGTLRKGEYVTPDDKVCVSCHIPTLTELKSEVTGSAKDFSRAVYDISTAWMLRDDELNAMAELMRKECTIEPKGGAEGRVVPRVKLVKDGLNLCSRKVNVYV